MRLDDLLRISFRQVLRHRRRNIGVILAVALGTAGFILVVTMGQDVKTNLNQDLELLGGATRIKLVFDPYSEGLFLGRTEWFREETREAVQDLPKVAGVSLLSFKAGRAAASVRGRRYGMTLVGVDEYFWDVNSFHPTAGRLFGPAEVSGRQKVCVLGDKLASDIFGTLDVIGKLMPIGDDIYTIIGILGGLGVSDRADWAFIPLTTFQDRVSGDPRPRYMYVRCRTWDDVKTLSDDLPAVIAAHQPSQGLQVDVAWERLKQVRRVSWWVELFIQVSVVATLVLGGFGIWNIMMVAVRTRTREIGLKKAMGAEDSDILQQFLTEALCLSVASAVAGIVLGRSFCGIGGLSAAKQTSRRAYSSCAYFWGCFLQLFSAWALACTRPSGPAVWKWSRRFAMSENSNGLLIELTNLTKDYQSDDGDVIRVLGNVNLRINRGEMVAIMGPSGSGKSTMLFVLGLFLLPTSGNYSFAGQDVLSLGRSAQAVFRRNQVGFVFQSADLLENSTVYENLEFPLVYSRFPRRDRPDRIRRALEQVNLGHRLHHPANRLSGGERQRVAVARALVNQPQVILADEPTGQLDRDNSQVVMDHFADIVSGGETALVLVTHDAQVASRCDRVYLMDDGALWEQA